MSDTRDLEIDKIYNKHLQLDRIKEFDDIYAEIRTNARQLNRKLRIVELVNRAKMSEDEENHFSACAEYLVAGFYLLSESEAAKQQSGLDVLDRAIRLALPIPGLRKRMVEALRQLRNGWLNSRSSLYAVARERIEEHELFMTELTGASIEVLIVKMQDLARTKEQAKKFDDAIALYEKCTRLLPQSERYSDEQLAQLASHLHALRMQTGNEP